MTKSVYYRSEKIGTSLTKEGALMLLLEAGIQFINCRPPYTNYIAENDDGFFCDLEERRKA